MKPRRADPITRLVDANPRFYRADGREGVGVMLDCPIHAECRFCVPFKNPIDGGPPHDLTNIAWERSGGTFETLTLTPSIRMLGGAEGCEWHGFIRAGRFETCGDSR